MPQRSGEKPPPSATRGTTDGEDLGRFLDVCVQRGDGVAGEVDELRVPKDVREHRLGALVVGIEIVEGALETLARIANAAPGRARLKPTGRGRLPDRRGPPCWHHPSFPC